MPIQATVSEARVLTDEVGTEWAQVLNCVQTTYLQEPCILALLHSFLNQLQGLLQILPVNGILDLVVAAEKNRVVDGRHCEELPLGRIVS